MGSKLLQDYEEPKVLPKHEVQARFYCTIIIVSIFVIVLCLVIGFHNMNKTKSISGVNVKTAERIVNWPDPPPHEDVAKVARYIMHISNWGSLASISSHKEVLSFPFVNIFSVSDGPIANASGIPYFYFTPLDLSVKDFQVNKQTSLALTEAQSNYCSKRRLDPQDPRCAHIILSGTIQKLIDGTDEHAFAKEALFTRHLEMSSWPKDHGWFFAKLQLEHIYVLDFFGGAKTVPVEEYLKANPFWSN